MSLSQWMLPVRAGVQHVTGRQPRVPDRASTALACQLSRVAGSAAWLARVGPHGQQCDCLVHQPARLSMIMSHVTTHPSSPPLESNLTQHAIHNLGELYRAAIVLSQQLTLPGEW